MSFDLGPRFSLGPKTEDARHVDREIEERAELRAQVRAGRAGADSERGLRGALRRVRDAIRRRR